MPLYTRLTEMLGIESDHLGADGVRRWWQTCRRRNGSRRPPSSLNEGTGTKVSDNSEAP
jgi:hypothetical protein